MTVHIVSAKQAVADGVSASALFSIARLQEGLGNGALAAAARMVGREVAVLTGVSLDCVRTRRAAARNSNRPVRPRDDGKRAGSKRSYGKPRSDRRAA